MARGIRTKCDKCGKDGGRGSYVCAVSMLLFYISPVIINYISLQSERSQTRIIEEIIRHIREFTMNSTELSVSFATGEMQFNYTYLFDLKKKILEKHRRGEHKGLRYISNIDNSNVEVTRKFLDAGANIKHVKNLPPMSFGVSDKEMITS